MDRNLWLTDAELEVTSSKTLPVVNITELPGGGFGVFKPPEIPKFWQSWAEVVLKYQKLRKFYYMK
jgi:hypothetical protein